MNGLSPGKYVPATAISTDPFSSRYTVQEDIGRGKFAVVRKCVNNETGEVVAAKVIRKRRKGKSCRDEILREVVMLELAMAHPRLVSLREVFETNTELILVTEYCSGGELFHECVINESFQEDDVRKLLVQILEGLAYLHDNNIVHLDLKPQNILLTKPFPNGDVKICDLGFACLTDTGEDIRDIIGTPDYVAPEVLDYEPLNIQTDMWSLGVLTYVMLTTCSPFAGDDQNETFSNITQVKLDFPDELFGHINVLAQDFITKLLVKKPRDRLTANECLDHPWLADLTKKLAISVPTPDHSFELAQEMVTPSNWRLSVDRQTSLSSSLDNSLNSTKGSLVENNSYSSTTVDAVAIQQQSSSSLNEEKDSISKPLSHIDIDHGTNLTAVSSLSSCSSSSSSHYQTCVNSLDSKSESTPPETADSFASLPSLKDEQEGMLLSSSESSLCPKTKTVDVMSTTMLSSSSLTTEENHNLSKFAAEFVQETISESAVANTNGNNNATQASSVTVSVIQSLDITSSNLSSSENGKPTNTTTTTTTTLQQHSASPDVNCLSHDSNKQHNSHVLKRMSMEIPPKKAKCIVDSATTSLSCDQPPQLATDTNGQAVNHNNNNNNSIDDYRNAV